MGSLYLSFYNIIFYTVFPVFAVILTGCLLRQTKLFDEKFASGLLQLVFYVAMPALMFLEMAKSPIQEIVSWNMGKLILAFGSAQLIVFIIGLLSVKYFYKSGWLEAFIGALTGSISNTALLGIPLLIGLFGNPVVVPATVTVVFVSVVFMPFIFYFMERVCGTRLSDHKAGFWSVFLITLKNPLIFAPLLGLCLSALNWPVPRFVDTYANYLQMATVPAALLAIGMTLTYENVKGSLSYSSWISFLKLMLLPAIGLAFIHLLNVPPLYAVVTVLVCGIPTAKMIMMLTVKYQVDVERTASSLFMSHAFGFITMMFWVVVLNTLYPQYFMYYANIDFT